MDTIRVTDVRCEKGDSSFLIDDGKTIVPSYLVSISDSLESIKRVKQLEIASVLAPHYGILNAQQTEYFLENMAQASQQTAEDILHSLKQGKSDDEIIGEFKDIFYHGYIREIYPEEAINLNTSIMIELVRKELLNV